MSNRELHIEDGRDLGAFIPANLDDYGLTPDEFRIYSRLARRAGNGVAHESVASMAKACKICDQVVKAVLRFLCESGMATRVPCPGRPSRYRLMPARNWAHPELLDEIRARCAHHPGRAVTQATSSPRSTRHSGDSITQYPGDSITQYPGDSITQKGTPERYSRKESEKAIPIVERKALTQTVSTAVADEDGLMGGMGFEALEDSQMGPESGQAQDTNPDLAQEAKGGKKASSEKSSKKKKQKPREYGYLKVFQDDDAMKQEFIDLYRAHPKHTCARQAAEAYYRLRHAGATAEEISAAHQEALQHDWRGRTVQLHPKLSDWLTDLSANRDLGITDSSAALLFPEHYRQVRDDYFQVCCELDAPFGDEDLAQAVWNAHVRDSELNCTGIVEATAYYLEKKRNRQGEPIARFERYLQHRWQVALAHKQLQQNSAVPSAVTKDFLPWFRLAVSAGVVQNFSTTDTEISGLAPGSIGVIRVRASQWEDWRAIAQEYPMDYLQRLKLEQNASGAASGAESHPSNAKR